MATPFNLRPKIFRLIAALVLPPAAEGHELFRDGGMDGHRGLRRDPLGSRWEGVLRRQLL